MGDVPPTPGSEDFLGQESQQHSFVNQHAFASQLDMTTPPSHGNGRQNPYNMAAMASNLPQVAHGGYRPPGGYPSFNHQQRFNPHPSSPPMMQQTNNPYASQQQNMTAANHHYYMPQHPQGQQYYGAPLSPTQPQVRSGMGYYSNQMMMGAQQPNHHMPPGYYYQPPAPGPGYHQGMPQPMMASQYYGHNMMIGDIKGPQSPTVDEVGSQYTQASQDAPDGNARIVRGPPRKPRQSGHAIWIGNLPPQTDLMSLVHHACKEAPGLESLFLISKSNCAFANFKDEATCIAAQQGLHDSKFQSVRLVSRLRKSTVEGATGVTAPTGPAATVEPSAPQEPPVEFEKPTTDKDKEEATETTPVDTQATPDGEPTVPKDKFFILKSLTVEDLELSVRTGIWATQSHNEEVLNNAFQAVDNVYLVFSANKSGEYYGYARMVSPINEDPEAAIQFAPKIQTANDMDLPKAIPTEATEFAPKGRIIDDSARGTIFWEAERENAESDEEEESDASSGIPIDGDISATKAWGKPFKLEWLSTTRLPFYRTRGLRNPWNSNREVKIARDGTELEPSVGRRLIGLFNRVQSPVPGAIPMAMRPAMMVPGFPAMRPYHG